jgi:RNA-directed DNA polymerase
MCASDVTATLDQALAASGLDRATVVQRPRLLSTMAPLMLTEG